VRAEGASEFRNGHTGHMVEESNALRPGPPVSPRSSRCGPSAARGRVASRAPGRTARGGPTSCPASAGTPSVTRGRRRRRKRPRRDHWHSGTSTVRGSNGRGRVLRESPSPPRQAPRAVADASPVRALPQVGPRGSGDGDSADRQAADLEATFVRASGEAAGHRVRAVRRRSYVQPVTPHSPLPGIARGRVSS
jgi:hypothetical protein